MLLQLDTLLLLWRFIRMSMAFCQLLRLGNPLLCRAGLSNSRLWIALSEVLHHRLLHNWLRRLPARRLLDSRFGHDRLLRDVEIFLGQI